MPIFDLFKSKPKIEGEIGYHGLVDWWLSEFSEAERKHIEEVFKPLSTGGHEERPLTQGKIFSTTESAIQMLTALAGWFKKEDRGIAERILAKAETLLPDAKPIDRHFTYQSLIEFHYQDRATPVSLTKATEYCRKQIEMASSVKNAFRGYMGDQMPSHVGYYQLSVILDGAGQFAEAIAICKQAKRQGWAGDWDKRIERYQKKLDKSGGAGA